MERPGFFDCVQTQRPSIGNIFESFFYWEGITSPYDCRKYTCVDSNQYEVILTQDERQPRKRSDYFLTALKIFSCFLGVPLVMLIGKGINRAMRNYQIIDQDALRERHADRRANNEGLLALAPQPAQRAQLQVVAERRNPYVGANPQETIQLLLEVFKWGKDYFNQQRTSDVRDAFNVLNDSDRMNFLKAIENKSQFDTVDTLILVRMRGQAILSNYIKQKEFGEVWKSVVEYMFIEIGANLYIDRLIAEFDTDANRDKHAFLVALKPKLPANH